MQFVKIKFACALAAISLVTGFESQAVSVKADARAARGCMPLVSADQAEDAIKRFNLKPVNAEAAERRALGTALIWIEKLNGDRPLREAVASNDIGYAIKFFSRVGVSRQTGNGVEISRNGAKNYGQNIAQLVHELGHFVGNNGAYEEYRTALGGTSCIVSSYGASRFNEQFAEVFAAFVTKPSLITGNGSEGCRRAFKYMSQSLFADGDLAKECVSGQLSTDKLKSLEK